MILIAGPGRSGTSVLASAYQEAGVPVHGEWEPAADAGLEDPEIVTVNKRVCEALGVSMFGFGVPVPTFPPHGRMRGIRALIPAEIRRKGQQAHFEIVSTYKRLTERQPFMIQWDRVEEVAAELGRLMRELAADRPLAKDPLFSLTLPVWLAAGAQIDHVVVPLRDMGASIESRVRAGKLGRSRPDETQNSIVYAIGVLLTTLWDSDVPYMLLRYPDWLDDLDELARSLPLPPGIERTYLEAALKKMVDPKMVHITM